MQPASSLIGPVHSSGLVTGWHPRGLTDAPEGEQQAMSRDSEEPPSESCSSLVSLDSR